MNQARVHLRPQPAPGLDLIKWTAPAVLSLMILAVMAFWPRYLSSPVALGTPYIHFHAVPATLWFLLLFNPAATDPLSSDDTSPPIGYVSLLLAPLVVAAFVLAAHSQLTGRSSPELWAARALHSLSPAVAGGLFGVFWLMGMLKRKDRPGACPRFMAATGLTFIDPVLARLLPELGIPKSVL